MRTSAAGQGQVELCWSIALEIASRFFASEPKPPLVLLVLAGVLVIGLAALVAPEPLRLAGEIARVGPRVAVRGVLDQLLLGELEALGLAAAALADGALLFPAALVQVVRLELVGVLHRASLGRLFPPADSTAGGRERGSAGRQHRADVREAQGLFRRRGQVVLAVARIGAAIH